MTELIYLKSLYGQQAGLPTMPDIKPVRLSHNYSKFIADSFDKMQHNPQHPFVARAYAHLAEELSAQFEFLRYWGFECLIFDGSGEPYKNSAEMRRDVFENRSLTIFATENGFGENTPEAKEAMLDNPLLRPTKYESSCGQHKLLVNDLLRFVHDLFGHCVWDNGFGQLGEEIAWWTHYTMFSPSAGQALTTETRGQNSWVNFGAHLRNEKGDVPQSVREKGYIHPKDRPYADQKIGLLPMDCLQLKHYYK